MVFIINFNISRKLSDIEYYYNEYNGTNINFLIDDITVGKTRWSVPKKACPGDIVIFMCAKIARSNLGMATSHIPNNSSDSFISFVNQQKTLYKKYSGCIMAYGVIASKPEKDCNWWMSDIHQLVLFKNAIHIDDFRSFIFISRTNSFTFIDDNQWEHLKWIIDQKNPGSFPNVAPPDVKTFEQEFETAVKNASKKTLEQLKKEIKKKKSIVSYTTVKTKVYQRSPIIAAFVKKRANGYCQLCEMKAPFYDKNGEPYLECHHLKWLSQGGQDSIDNCVALCPNCHRKMHTINDINDIQILETKIKK